MTRAGTKILTVAGILLATLLTLPTAVSASPRQGADTPSPFAGTITAQSAGPAHGLTGLAVANVITCTAKANNPHNSLHVPGTVNAVITTSCTSPVTRIGGIMSLYRDGVFVASGEATTTGSASMSMNAATPCVNGSYHATGDISVTFPPGYAPPWSDMWPVSATVPITCNTVGKVWVDTFPDAPGSNTPGGARTGTLYTGTNYVYCKVWGPNVQYGSAYNHWWLLTDLDTGNPWRNQYVSAYYLSRWGNDVARDNSGAVIRDC
jgi:hypothetical protein